MKSTASLTSPSIKIPKANLLTESELISIAKILDPKINLAGSRSVPGKNSVSSSAKNFNKQFAKTRIGTKKSSYTPLFNTLGGKSLIESDEKPIKMSKYVPKASPTKQSQNKSTTIGVTKRLNNTIMSSTSKFNSFVRKKERTEESSADFSSTLLRNQKSLQVRTGSPPFQRTNAFDSSLNNQIKSPKNLTKITPQKRTSPPKKGSVGSKAEVKNFRLEYLREEKLSKLSESQYGFDHEESKKPSTSSLLGRGPHPKASQTMQSPKASTSKLQQARMQQNLMNNVRNA